MPFKFNNVVVTLGNYAKIFEGYSADIMDEVRSAVLDDTPIGQYIIPCKQDSFKLGQIRKAMREYMPVKYINPALSGAVLSKIREAFADEAPLELLDKYISRESRAVLSDKLLCDLIDLTIEGVSIEAVDFNVVPTDLSDLYIAGLRKHYPMWLFLGSDVADRAVIKLLMKGMALGIDIHPFLSGTWDTDQITTVLRSVDRIDFNTLMMHINSNFDSACIGVIVTAVGLNLDYKLLCLKDDSEHPWYNFYQMSVLLDAMRCDLLTTEMCKPSLSDLDMQDMLFAEKEKRRIEEGKRLGGTLRK